MRTEVSVVLENGGKRGIATRAVAGLAMTGVAASMAAASAHAATSRAGGDAASDGSRRLIGNGALYYGREVGSAMTLRAVDASGDRSTPLAFTGQGMSWSPDGANAAVVVGKSVVVYDAELTHPVTVYTVPASETGVSVASPVWLADGSAIAFAKSGGSSKPALWTVKPDGTGAAPLAVPDPLGTGHQIFDVLPDGGYVLDDFSATQATISVWHPGEPALTPVATGQFDTVRASPDGTRLAVDETDPKTGQGSLHVIDLASHHDTPLASTIEPAIAWSPDGTEIAFAAVDANSGKSPTGTHVAVWNPGTGAVSAAVPPATGVYTLPAAWRPVVARTQQDRVGGGDRVATAIATSQLGFAAAGAGGRQAASAVLSRSDTFADALAGSALAAHKKGPLLLTGTKSLDPTVAKELTRVLPAHATVYLLGGTSALSDNVLHQVAALGFTPVRVAGQDRDATAVAIAKQITATPHTFLVATGRDYPDALAAGAVAGAQSDAVVLLSDDNTLPQATRDYLAASRHAGDSVFGVGNQGSNALASALPLNGITGQFRGTDRFDTARQLAVHFYSGASKPATVGVATGFNWPDALGGGALLGTHPGPLLLSGPSGLPAGESTYLAANSTNVEEIVVFGGTSVVTKAAADAVANTAKGAGNWDYHLNRVAPLLP
ncbi:putative cell wall-binding protein [Catenulispora sp. MAP12-49]|uniref:cell wall-binding repeat-containing protein n=1 Tax=Catenulispora sp. MAP12-49 TaxID=3156302 RepID=UPI003517193C